MSGSGSESKSTHKLKYWFANQLACCGEKARLQRINKIYVPDGWRGTRANTQLTLSKSQLDAAVLLRKASSRAGLWSST